MIKLPSLLVTIILFIFFQTSFAQNQNFKNAEKQNFKTLSELARNYYNKQNIDTALIYSKKALIQAEAEFGKDTNYCNTLSLLLELSYYSGNIKQGIEYGLVEKELRKKLQGEKHPGYATSLNNLAQLYELKIDFVAAEPLFLEALKAWKNVLGPEHPEYAISLNNLANFYQTTGNYAAAEPLYLEAIRIRKKTIGEDHIDYAMSLNCIASLYTLTGDYTAAETAYLQALSIRKKTLGIKHPYYSNVLNNLAGLYVTMGNYKAAEILYLEALKIRGETLGIKDPDYAITLTALAILYQYMDNLPKAEKLILQASKIVKDSLGVKHPDYAISLNTLAGIYKSMGNYNAAENLLLEAIKIRKDIFGEKNPEYANSLNKLGALYLHESKYSKAEPLLLESLKIREEILGKKHPDFAVSQKNLATLKLLTGNYKAAEELFLNTISITNESIKKKFNTLSEKEKEFYFKTQNDYFESFYSFSNKRKIVNPAITEEVYNSVIKNKGLLLKSSTAMRSAILNSSDTSLINKYNQWVSLNKELSKLYSIQISKRKKDPELLEKQANDLEKELVKGSEIYSGLEKIQNLNWQGVQKNLKPNEAAIEFIHFTEGLKKDTITYCAILITQKSKYPEMIELFSEKELIKLLGSKSETNELYITGIYGNRNKTNTKLYDLIWKPIEKNLKGIKVIYYSPSGLLHKVSFAALSKSKDNYLCANYRIELMGSTSKVALPETFDFNSLLSTCIFGDIQYDTKKTLKDTNALLSWPYLEGTKTEAEKVVSILKANNLKVDYVYGENATEAEFKSKAPNSNVVHVATHGFFFNDPDAFSYAEKQDSGIIETRAYRGGSKAFGINNFIANKNPLMRSGLAFAGANEVWVNDHNTDKEDGVLTAQEVTGMDLRKINLLVLSACETGLGDIKGTEGVYGLQRSFKMAGVKYIIMSLWQVPDSETVEFMDKFYSKFSKSKDLKLSFYETQKEMRIKYDPFYWAAFLLME